MAVYKRGNVWWYKFSYRGELIRESTRQRNKRVAEQIEAAHKTGLAKGEVGIRDRKPVPTLAGFAPRFVETIETQCAEKPATISFYKAKVDCLLKYPPLASATLDAIDESMIDAYKQKRSRQTSRRGKPYSVASVNRELATLRRLLRLAHEWKIINRVPRVRLLRGEKNREFVLSHQQEKLYLDSAPQPLDDVALMLIDTGFRVGEAVSLEWPEVHLEPTNGAKLGYLTVRAGKSKNSKFRHVPLTGRVRKMLKRRGPHKTGHVFLRTDGRPLSQTRLDQQHSEVRELLKLSQEFVLHSLRHTFGTRLGESRADVFTIMKLMGHSSVTVSQRYVHPSPESIERAFERLETLNTENGPDGEKWQKQGTESGTAPDPVLVSVQ